MIVTVAMFESLTPSVASKVKESVPLKSAAGVYVRLALAPASVPCSGSVRSEYVSESPSASVAPSVSGSAVSSSVDGLWDEATGELSSSVIVPSPCPSWMWPPVGLDRLTTRSSSSSSLRSPATSTVSVRLETPVGKLSIPDAGAKSTPEVAVTPAVS